MNKEIPQKTLDRVYKMKFNTVYPLLVQKAEKKGRTQAEVDELIFWLTGYDVNGLEEVLANDVDIEHFYRHAPQMNPNASLITGVICGYRVEEIEDEIMRQVRYLDKIIDELVKGKSLDKIKRG